jgi:chromosome segregation ATPase
MGLLDDIEKLINEHGSASILKERIELANDKYSALERRLSDSEQRVEQLEREKQALELETYKLRDKVRNLAQQLANPDTRRLEEIKEKLLVAVSSSREASAPQLGRIVGVGEQAALFHLEELRKSGLVSVSHFYTGQASIWRLAHEGTAPR